MAFSATLHIDGHPKNQDGLKVEACDFIFAQDTDQRGMPTSNVKGGSINITLKNENDYDILQWMFSQSTKKSGKIKMSSSMADNQSFQTIEFKDGVLVKYHQTFSEDAEVLVHLTISARQISVGGASFENTWIQ